MYNYTIVKILEDRLAGIPVKSGDTIVVKDNYKVVQINQNKSSGYVFSYGSYSSDSYKILKEFKSQFQLGDEVFFKEESSLIKVENNPRNVKGTILCITNIEEFIFKVQWSNGMENSYREQDLKFVKEVEPESNEKELYDNPVIIPKEWQLKVDNDWSKYPEILEMRKVNDIGDDSEFYEGKVTGWDGYISNEFCYDSLRNETKPLISYEYFLRNFYKKPVEKEPDLKDILEEVKKRYPPGTVFKCLHDCAGGPVNDLSEFVIEDSVIRWCGNSGGVGCVYDPHSEEKFAPIVSKSFIEKEEDWDALLREANERFPIGCKFQPILRDGTYSNIHYTQKRECYLYPDLNQKWVIGSANIRNPNGQWAKLVEEPEKKEEIKYIMGVDPYVDGIMDTSHDFIREVKLNKPIEQAFDDPVILKKYTKTNKILTV